MTMSRRKTKRAINGLRDKWDEGYSLLLRADDRGIAHHLAVRLARLDIILVRLELEAGMEPTEERVNLLAAGVARWKT